MKPANSLHLGKLNFTGALTNKGFELGWTMKPVMLNAAIGGLG